MAILVDGGFFIKRYRQLYGKGHELSETGSMLIPSTPDRPVQPDRPVEDGGDDDRHADVKQEVASPRA